MSIKQTNEPQLNSNELTDDELRQKLNLETGKIDWSELQRHFARGAVISVSADLDLIEAAIKFTHDDRSVIEDWLTIEKIKRADDDNARQWEHKQPIFWAIVIAPWILVQEQTQEQQTNKPNS